MRYNIPDVEYKLSRGHNSFCGAKGMNCIYIGMPKAAKTMSDDDLIKYLSDVIAHEYIHHLLDYLFDDVKEITFLFDAIGDYLRLYPELNTQMAKLNGDGAMVWSESIKINGIEGLIDSYMLDYDKVKEILKSGI